MEAKGNTSFLDRHFSVISAGLILALCIFLYLPIIQNYSLTPKWIGLTIASVVLVILNGRYLKSSPSKLMISWWVFVVVCIASCFRSYNFWDSLLHLSPLIIAPIAVGLIKLKIENIESFYSKLSLVVGLIVLPLVLLTLYDILILMLNGDYNHDSTYSFRYSFGHRNQFSQFLVLVVPLLFASFKGGKPKKIFLLILVAFIYLTAILLKNRTVLIVLFGIYPMLLFFFAIRKKSRKIKGIILISFLVLAGTSFIVLKSTNLDPNSRIGNLLETNFGSGNERIRIWKNSIELAKEHPIIGYGTGDWKAEILRTPLRFTQAEKGEVFYQRAHNDFIQLLVEQGLLGLLLFVIFFVLALIRILKSTVDSKVKHASLAGVLGFMVIAFFSFPLEKVELLVLLFLFLIPVSKSTSTKTEENSRSIFKAPQFYVLTIVLVSLVSSLIYLLQMELTYFEYKKTSKVSVLGEINKDFYTIDPNSTPVYWHIANDLYQKGKFEKAITNYQLALKANPYHAHALNNTGSSYYALGEIDSAKLYYDKTLAVNPLFTETLMNYASLKFNEQDIDGALNLILEVVIEWEPSDYQMYIAAIGKAKCLWLIDLHDQPDFEVFLADAAEDPELLYQISVNCRTTGEDFEQQLRIYFSENFM